MLFPFQFSSPMRMGEGRRRDYFLLNFARKCLINICWGKKKWWPVFIVAFPCFQPQEWLLFCQVGLVPTEPNCRALSMLMVSSLPFWPEAVWRFTKPRNVLPARASDEPVEICTWKSVRWGWFLPQMAWTTGSLWGMAPSTVSEQSTRLEQ